MQRVLSTYGREKGALLIIVLAGIHGNEWAGINATHQLTEYLVKNQIDFNGKIVTLAGNLRALKEKTRFIHKDLNRQWYPLKVKKLHALPVGMLNTSEDIEQKELFAHIEYLLTERDNYDEVLMVDLHTTSAKGGCFSIVNDHFKSTDFAMMMPVPVIKSMTQVLKGTTLEYFENHEVPGLAFEAGQHTEPASETRIKAALMSIAYKSGCVNADIYEDFQEEVFELWSYNKGLPHVVEVKYHHAITEDDHFKMNPGYANFQEVSHGEILAHDKHGEVTCPSDGLILMPLYQKKGSDGFFVVEKVPVFEKNS